MNRQLILIAISLVFVVGFGMVSVQAGVLPPPAPTGVNVTHNCNSTNTVSWNGSLQATGYRVYRSLDPQNNYVLLATVTTTYYVDTHYSSAKWYYIILAYNSGGDSAYSSVVSSYFHPDEPKNLDGVQYSGPSIRLYWQGGDNSPTGYAIYRSKCHDQDGTRIGTVLAPTCEYIDATPPQGEDFYYRVYAYNGSVPSDFLQSCEPSNWRVRKACTTSDLRYLGETSSTHLFDCAAWYDQFLTTADFNAIFLRPEDYLIETTYTTSCEQIPVNQRTYDVISEAERLVFHDYRRHAAGVTQAVPTPVISTGAGNQYLNHLGFDTCDNPCTPMTLFTAGPGGPLIYDFDVVCFPDLDPVSFFPCLVTSFRLHWYDRREANWGIWECHAFAQVYTQNGWTNPVSVGAYATNGGGDACQGGDAQLGMPVSICRSPTGNGVVVSHGTIDDALVQVKAVNPYTGVALGTSVTIDPMYEVRKIDSVAVQNTDAILVAIASKDPNSNNWWLEVYHLRQDANNNIVAVGTAVYSTLVSGISWNNYCWPKIVSSNISDSYAALMTYNIDSANFGGDYVTFSYNRTLNTFTASQPGPTYPGYHNQGLSLLGTDYSFVGCGSNSNWWKGDGSLHIDRKNIQTNSACSIGFDSQARGVRSCGQEPDDVQHAYGLGFLMFPYYNTSSYENEFYAMPYYNIYPCAR